MIDEDDDFGLGQHKRREEEHDRMLMLMRDAREIMSLADVASNDWGSRVEYLVRNSHFSYRDAIRTLALIDRQDARTA